MSYQIIPSTPPFFHDGTGAGQRQQKKSFAAFLTGKLFILLPALLLAACSTNPPTESFAPPVYPAPPDEPRFIFDRSLRYSSNVEPLSMTMKLRRYATGEVDEINGLVKPFGVAAHNSRIYVTDTVQRIVILFDLGGNRYKEFGKEGPGELFKPTGIDVSPQGEVFVADVTAHRISVFDTDGNFLRHIGDGKQLKRPSGVAISPDGSRLYVIDAGGVENDNHHLYIFNAQSGALLKTVGKRGSEAGEFNLPLQVTVANDGTVYVVDKGNFRIQAFDGDGNYKFSFGSIGRFPGQFFSPKGISTDPDGNIYVIDTAFGNAQLFNPQGELLMVIGQRGQSSAPGNYMLPAGIDVDEDGQVYIADQFFRKVDVYAPITRLERPD